MKHVVVYIVLLISTIVNAQIFDVETIKFSGANNKRINLVILSEGYQSSELTDFITDATNFTNSMFSESPFSEYSNYFNVYAIKVPSNESGADHPATGTNVDESGATPVFVDTYFNATYDAFDNHWLLFYEIDGNNANNTEAKILTVLANNFPSYDQALILVNSPQYGGSGGTFPMAYNGFWGANVIMHEMGHSLFDLKDEYYPGDLLAAEAINMTQETNPTLIKWKNWLNINNVGIYQYLCSEGNCSDWYKPHENCMMEMIDKPFCSVCKEGMIEKIHNLVSPVDSYNPNSNTLNNPSFPLDFDLTLLHPTNQDLERSWTLNTTNVANNVDNISLIETDLNEGANALSVVVTDSNSFLKVDNHETVHVYTITWTINYSSLGVNDITSVENRFKINMFPNPTTTLLNFKIESEANSNLKMDLLSLDGKKVMSTRLNSLSKINISQLTSGIYLANIYADNILIASKKVVKN